MKISSFFKHIDDWFFKKQDSWPLAVFRIALGLTMLLKLLFLFDEIELWFSDYGMLDLASSQKILVVPRLNLFEYFSLFQSITVAKTIWLLAFLFSITFCLGIYARLSAFFAYVLLTSLDHRNVLILQDGDSLLRVTLFWMIFAHSSHYYSLSSWIKRNVSRQNTTASAWPLRAIQIQLCLVYISTFWHKTEGNTWWDGTAVYVVSQLSDFQRFDIWGLYSSWVTIKLATWITLAFEGLFPLLIWFQDTRRWFLALGLIFHLGLEWHLSIPLFQWIMISSYCVFLKKEDVAKLKSLKSLLSAKS